MRGGLHFASDDVFTICHCSEKILRRHNHILLDKNIYFKIVSETLKIVLPHIFSNDKHNFEQEALYDHRQQLIYLIVQNYVEERLKHESDKLSDVKYRIRMHNNKMTLFKGE